MTENTFILSMPLIQAAQAQKHITHNEALLMLDALVQPVVTDAHRTVAPGDPQNGDRHIVAPGASGEWQGHDGDIAFQANNGWLYLTPARGWRFHVSAEGEDRVYDGETWAPGAGATISTLPVLGLNAAADDTNRLTVAAPATLLNNEGGGHQLKINKAGTADTASLLFQTDFSGRAEMGCAGEDAFSIKVSADGANFTTALRFDGATGLADGAAVQTGPDDIAPGKLARTDWTWGQGNLLAPVALTAGRPTGGVIERIETEAGIAIKFADGTMICYGRPELTYASGFKMLGIWQCPAQFSDQRPVVTQASIDHASAWGTMSVQPQFLTTMTHDPMPESSIRFTQYSSDGAPPFAAGDVLVVHAMAIGSWA